MALIKCNECGKEISDTAETCPSCGKKNNMNQEATMGVKIICFLIPIVGFIIFAINISTKPKYAKQCLTWSILSIIIIFLLVVTFIALNQPETGTFTRVK